MSFWGKKKEAAKTCCDSHGLNTDAIEQKKTEKVVEGVQILGSGCAKCNVLEDSVRAALAELEMNIPIEHVTDLAQIAAYGVMTTPALVVNGRVVSVGRVLKKDDVIKIFQN